MRLLFTFCLGLYTAALFAQVASWDFENLPTAVPALPIEAAQMGEGVAYASGGLAGGNNIGSPAACSGDSWATNFWPTQNSAQSGYFLAFDAYAEPGRHLEIGGFYFSVGQSSSFSADGFTVTYELDEGGEKLLFAAVTSSTSCGGLGSPVGLVSKPGGSVVFRIYVYGQDPRGLAATIRIDNVVISGQTVLPVELMHFRAWAREDGNVRLEWQTAFEQSNDYFAVERAADGIHFSEAGRILGQGTSAEPQTYSFIDDAPLLGLNYYRLRQVDDDGKASYFQTISVLVEPSGSAGLHIYPTPAASRLTVHIPVAANTSARLQLFSMQGSQVKEWPADAPGEALNLELTGLPSGLYYLRLFCRDKTWQAPVLIAGDR